MVKEKTWKKIFDLPLFQQNILGLDRAEHSWIFQDQKDKWRHIEELRSDYPQEIDWRQQIAEQQWQHRKANNI